MRIFLENLFNEHHPYGRWFCNFITALIILSITAFCVETLPNPSAHLNRFLTGFELFAVTIFTAEYLLRIYLAPNKTAFIFSFYGVIDLLAILPFYLGGPDLRSSRIFRLFRLFRMFKLIRYSRALRHFQKAFVDVREELFLFLVATLFVLFLSSVGIYHFEHEAQPDKFGNIFDCMWWAVATLTTVGYGDTYPITTGGRAFTFLTLMIGLGVIAVPSGLIASSLTKTMEKKEN